MVSPKPERVLTNDDRELLMGDIEHLRVQCKRHGCEETAEDIAGIGGLMFREKTRLYSILHGI
jgi:hypothetical protein